MDKKIILLTGGGSGGHIFPLQAVAEKILKSAKENNWPIEVHYLGVNDAFSINLVGAGVVMHSLVSSKMRRYFSFLNFLDFPKFVFSIFQALWKLYWLMPDVIFSKGGPGALATILAGWFYRIPILVHESDSIPGLTNAISSRFAKRIAVSFQKGVSYFDPGKTFLSGNPIREDLIGDAYPSEAAKEELGFDRSEPLVLILGGSQGSERINNFILENLAKILEISQVLHQTGSEQFLEVKNLSRAVMLDMPLENQVKHRYLPVPFLTKDLRAALIAADLVIARSGSGTIFELAAFGKPAILIPLSESAHDHQRLNAFEFVNTGAGIVIEEENLLPGIFMKQFKDIITNQEKLERMKIASEHFFVPGAAEVLAKEVLILAGVAIDVGAGSQLN